MSVHKDDSTNTWRVVYRYTDYTGKNKQSQKRGFATKREALAWERENASKLETKLDMTFASFVEIYTEDMKKRVKENTWKTKEHIIETKILPHFKKRKIGEILPKDILAWQNKMLSSEDIQAIIITVLLITSSFGYRKLKNKNLSPIMLIVLAAIFGIVVY